MDNVILLADRRGQSAPASQLGQRLLDAALPADTMVLNTVLDARGLPDIPTPTTSLSHILELHPQRGTEPRALFDLASRAAGAAGLPIVGGFLADELVQVRYARYWPDGIATPGPKVMWLARKREDVTRAYFIERWHQHALMVWRVHVGMWRYVQNVVEDRIGHAASDVDGVAITHYRSVRDWATRQYENDAARHEVFADVSAFTAGADAYLTEELILRSPTPTPRPLRATSDPPPDG